MEAITASTLQLQCEHLHRGGLRVGPGRRPRPEVSGPAAIHAALAAWQETLQCSSTIDVGKLMHAHETKESSGEDGKIDTCTGSNDPLPYTLTQSVSIVQCIVTKRRRPACCHPNALACGIPSLTPHGEPPAPASSSFAFVLGHATGSQAMHSGLSLLGGRLDGMHTDVRLTH